MSSTDWRGSSVSDGAREPSVRRSDEWDRLELTVRRLLDDYDRCTERARTAERRLEELESTLKQVSSGGLDPVSLQARVDTLEAENRDLRGRLDQARERVARLLARLRFLEGEER